MTIRRAESLQAIINVALTVETEVECLNNLRNSKKSEIRDNVRNRNEHHRVHEVEGTRDQNKKKPLP